MDRKLIAVLVLELSLLFVVPPSFAHTKNDPPATLLKKADQGPKQEVKAEAKPETKKEEKPVTLEAPMEIQNKADNLIMLEKTVNMLKADSGIDKLENALQKKAREFGALIPVGYHYDPPTRKFVLDVTPEVKK